MDNRFIEEIEHEAKKPVSIEREPNDVVVIEGVRYAAELFRVLANPDAGLLYAFQRDGDQVIATVIHNAKEAFTFFVMSDLTAPMSTAAPLSEEKQDVV